MIGEKYYILTQICQALTFLHTSSPPLAHLDVKPANVMVNTLRACMSSCLINAYVQVDSMTLHTVLTDFGLARFISHTSAMGTRTMLAGSPGYQSPEQLRTESIGPPSDVYAFGGVCFVTLMEKPLWPGLSMFQIIQKVTNNEKPKTDMLEGPIRDLCNRCFEGVVNRPEIVQVLKQLIKIVAPPEAVSD